MVANVVLKKKGGGGGGGGEKKERKMGVAAQTWLYIGCLVYWSFLKVVCSHGNPRQDIDFLLIDVIFGKTGLVITKVIIVLLLAMLSENAAVHI